MKDILKITFADFWKGFYPKGDFFTPILSKEFNVILDAENPDIVICSTLHEMSKAKTYKQPKILYTGENHRPSDFDVDYSMSFDAHSENNYYFPVWQMECLQNPNYIDTLFNRFVIDVTKQHRFCAYIVGNPNNEERNNIFNVLSKYKHVHSYGKHFHNTDGMPPTGFDNKLNYLRANPHKFIVAYESNSYLGYCTEKILHAFLVGAIPIYKGDPLIAEQFNENSFVNANNMAESEVVEYIEYLDTNEIAYCDMQYQPVFTEEQKQRFLSNINNLPEWLIRITRKCLLKKRPS